MIKVGDLVRYKNNYLSARSFGVGSRHGKKFKRFRGKQRISRVIASFEKWDWRTKKHNQVVRLDDGKLISTHWLVFVRRPAERFSVFDNVSGPLF